MIDPIVQRTLTVERRVRRLELLLEAERLHLFQLHREAGVQATVVPAPRLPILPATYFSGRDLASAAEEVCDLAAMFLGRDPSPYELYSTLQAYGAKWVLPEDPEDAVLQAADYLSGEPNAFTTHHS